MLTKKYNRFSRKVKKELSALRKKKVIEKPEFDAFIGKIMSSNDLDVPGKIYCRDGCAYVHKVDRQTFQVLAFQINSFGEGIFDKGIKKLCTPVMLTIKTFSSQRKEPIRSIIRSYITL